MIMLLLSSAVRLRATLAAVVVAAGIGVCVQYVQAQSHAQIGTNSPLPVFVTNPQAATALPDGFVAGSRWKFITWTTPSVLTWTATVTKTAGGWANLRVSAEDGTTTMRWYYVPAMPGSWEPQ
jgi:hypothetical protein